MKTAVQSPSPYSQISRRPDSSAAFLVEVVLKLLWSVSSDRYQRAASTRLASTALPSLTKSCALGTLDFGRSTKV